MLRHYGAVIGVLEAASNPGPTPAPMLPLPCRHNSTWLAIANTGQVSVYLFEAEIRIGFPSLHVLGLVAYAKAEKSNDQLFKRREKGVVW